MDVIIDTFSWKKFDLLEKNKLFNMKSLYEWSNVNITHEVYNEIKHFRLKSCALKSTSILPIKNKKIYQEAKDLEFDEADSQILSHGGNDRKLIIISEDKPLLKFCRGYSFDAMQIIDLFHLFAIRGFINHKELYQVNRFLRKYKNITEKKSNQIKNWLKQGQI